MAGGLKIMVVDDDSNICELLRLYLEKEGFEAIIAPNGAKALEMFDTEKPDLMLLDVMMPQLDGWQVCREIRKKSACPIIIDRKSTRLNSSHSTSSRMPSSA